MRKIISVENLSKRYTIGPGQRYAGSARESLGELVKAPFQKNGNRLTETVWALRDVSFEVEEGELFGIIGHNGAGKSTLLKILSQITEPTSGRAKLYGRIGSLLEVGTGFHPELTGRENVYLNGSILGMKRTEIARKFDEIVTFAGVERFLDTPVKRYSTGMYMRLAFSVTAHLDSDILLVDEVLAVGDADFQNKCLKKMREVVKGGRTVLLVSHNMTSITRLCSRSMWIDHGRIQTIGPSDEVAAKYLLRKNPSLGEYISPEAAREHAAKVAITAVRIRNSEGQVSGTMNALRPFTIEIDYEIFQQIPFIWIGFTLSTFNGLDVLAGADGDVDDYAATLRTPGKYRSVCQIPAKVFNAGSYLLSAYAARTLAGGNAEIFVLLEHILAFDIEQAGGLGSHMPNTRIGVMSPSNLDWQVSSADLQEVRLPGAA